VSGLSAYEERIDGTLTRIEEYMARSADSFEFSRSAAEDAKAARAAAEGVAHEFGDLRATLREHEGKFSDLEALTDGLRQAFENQAAYFEANKEVIEFVKELRAGFPLLWEYMREVIAERTRAKEASAQHGAEVLAFRAGQQQP
jgi:hypothetical protein